MNTDWRLVNFHLKHRGIHAFPGSRIHLKFSGGAGHRRRVLVFTGGLILSDFYGAGVACPRKFLKLGALKLHFQHSEIANGYK